MPSARNKSLNPSVAPVGLALSARAQRVVSPSSGSSTCFCLLVKIMSLSAFHAHDAWEAVFVMISVVAASITLISLGFCVHSRLYCRSSGPLVEGSDCCQRARQECCRCAFRQPLRRIFAVLDRHLDLIQDTLVCCCCRVNKDDVAPHHGGHCIVGCALAVWYQCGFLVATSLASACACACLPRVRVS